MNKHPSPKHSDKQIQSYLQYRWLRYTIFMNEQITLLLSNNWFYAVLWTTLQMHSILIFGYEMLPNSTT